MKMNFHAIILALLPASVSAQKEDPIAVKKQTLTGEPKLLRGMRDGRSRALVAPVNDVCSGAQKVNIGDIIKGNILEAKADPENSEFGFLSSQPGVWYNVVGTGGAFIVDTCGSSFHTRPAIFTGSCGNLTYLSRDTLKQWGDCRSNFKAVWNTQKGQEYFIFVYGDWNYPWTSDGNFQFNVL